MIVKATAALLAGALGIALFTAAAVGSVVGQLFGGSGGSSAPSSTALTDIPPAYLLLYEQAAATCPGLDWSVLAGIGKLESDHGRATAPGVHAGQNSAGAEGPMQFLPATFTQYAQPVPDGGANPPSPYDPVDAIYAASHDLCANGARNGTDLHAAIYAYNHSDTYVTSVLTQAALYAISLDPGNGNESTGRSGGGGTWTPQIGQAIVARAMHWLGWPYSWAAGNAQGPTLGRAVDAASRNDGHVVGFDCSGLVLYALAPWRALAHDAATQYTQAGTLHPAIEQLLPGDLVFWSANNTIAGIEHVAIYLGNNQVIQAPYSGAYINTLALNNVEPGYYGATRPLT